MERGIDFLDGLIGHLLHFFGLMAMLVLAHGTLVGPLQVDITGFAEVTPYKGGWCGNDAFVGGIEKERRAVIRLAQKLGDRLYKSGYKGAFCMSQADEIYDEDEY